MSALVINVLKMIEIINWCFGRACDLFSKIQSLVEPSTRDCPYTLLMRCLQLIVRFKRICKLKKLINLELTQAFFNAMKSYFERELKILDSIVFNICEKWYQFPFNTATNAQYNLQIGEDYFINNASFSNCTSLFIYTCL